MSNSLQISCLKFCSEYLKQLHRFQNLRHLIFQEMKKKSRFVCLLLCKHTYWSYGQGNRKRFPISWHWNSQTMRINTTDQKSYSSDVKHSLSNAWLWMRNGIASSTRFLQGQRLLLLCRRKQNSALVRGEELWNVKCCFKMKCYFYFKWNSIFKTCQELR